MWFPKHRNWITSTTTSTSLTSGCWSRTWLSYRDWIRGASSESISARICRFGGTKTHFADLCALIFIYIINILSIDWVSEMIKYHSNKLNLRLIVVDHEGQKQRLRSQLSTDRYLRLRHSLNRPRYQPVSRIHLNHYHISVLYPRTTLPALPPIIHIPRILVVTNILFIVLRS